LRLVNLPEEGSEGARTRLQNGDVLISITADIGIIGYVSPNVPKPAYINQHIALVRFDPPSANSKFISYFLASETPQRLFRALTDSGAKAGMSLTTVQKMCVALPPTKAEQEAIAEALSDADALIESLEQLIAKKRHLKQGAIQTLLRPKNGWAEKSLLELAGGKKELFDDGDWIESEHITSEGVRLVQTGNIGIGHLVEKNAKKYISQASFERLGCKEIKEGDVLICRLAEPAGRACVLPNIGEAKMVTSVDVTIFRPPYPGVNRKFLVSLFSTNKWLMAVSDCSGGTTRKRISRSSLGRLRIKVPPLDEQNDIAETLSDMDAEIAALEAKLAKARQIKQGMMQNLLTGRIRLV
jgi:type I restriction enzyme S subunit